mmetsp:Transcript_14874/g.37084  ORF Transcript_14874/g.37084 Transcript_14874/m.37084 type:complete len:361 (+) Transcript_14874:280-1362(+)
MLGLSSTKTVDWMLFDRGDWWLIWSVEFFGNAIIVRAVLRAANQLHKILVVRDHDELKVGLLFAGLDDVVEGAREGFDVGLVQIGRRLVEREDAAVEAEGLRQREADDEACEHLLPRRAAAAHVERGALLVHLHTVRVLARAALALALVLRVDLDVVDVGPLVRLVPQLLDLLVDVLHLRRVELHQCAVERVVVPLQVQRTHLHGLVLDQLLPMLRVDVFVLGFFELPLERRRLQRDGLKRAFHVRVVALALVDLVLRLLQRLIHAVRARQLQQLFLSRLKLIPFLLRSFAMLAQLQVGVDQHLKLILGVQHRPHLIPFERKAFQLLLLGGDRAGVAIILGLRVFERFGGVALDALNHVL